MKTTLKYILASIACFGLAQQAHAAKWGAIVDKGCSAAGGRLYTAKIWTGFRDKGPSTECKRTKAKVGNSNRVPDRCVNKKVGPASLGVVYGEWTVSDASCPAPGVLQRPAVMPTVQPGEIQTNVLQRKRFATNDPLATIAYKLEDLGTEVVGTFETMKAAIKPLAGKLLGIDKLEQAAKDFHNGAQYAKFSPLVNDLASILKSDNPNAAAARAHILNEDSDAAMISLMKLPAFVTLSETVEKDPNFRSFSIGLVGDAQYVGTLNGELGMAFGPVLPKETSGSQTQAEEPPAGSNGGFGYMPYYALGYGAGATYGLDASVAIGIWRGALDDLAGDTHGIVLGGAYHGGLSASFWWGYATDTDDDPDNDKQIFKIAPSEFTGFVIAPQGGYSVEAEYNRAFMKASGPQKFVR